LLSLKSKGVLQKTCVNAPKKLAILSKSSAGTQLKMQTFSVIRQLC